MLEGLWNSFSLNNWTLFRLMGVSRTVIRLWIKVISKLASCPGQLASNYLHHKDTRNSRLKLCFEQGTIVPAVKKPLTVLFRNLYHKNHYYLHKTST